MPAVLSYGGNSIDRATTASTLTLAAADERGRFEINGSPVYWPELMRMLALKAGWPHTPEHHYHARKAVERVDRLGRLHRCGA